MENNYENNAAPALVVDENGDLVEVLANNLEESKDGSN